MENNLDLKMIGFNNELMLLAKKHGVYGAELNTLFTWREEGGTVRYFLSDVPPNEFVNEAIALFRTHFH